MTQNIILFTYDQWYNSQLSIAAHFGGISMDGVEFCLISDHTNPGKPDLVRADWMSVYKRLGRDKTIGLINNGTSLKVAKEMIKQMKQKQYEKMAKDSHDLFARD